VPISTYFIGRVAVQTQGNPRIATLNEEKKKAKEGERKKQRPLSTPTTFQTGPATKETVGVIPFVGGFAAVCWMLVSSSVGGCWATVALFHL